MKKYIYISLIVLVALYMQSCEKETMVYKGESGGISGIYFLYTSSYTMSGSGRVDHYQDSMEFSFAKVAANISESTIKLPVKLLGDVTGYNRTFIARVTGGTAVVNEDYVALENEYIMPANQPETTIPLILKRTDKLKNRKLNLTVELIENENFKLLLPSKINDDGKTEINTTHIKVIFSEIYTEPWFYSLFGVDNFGPFTVKKFEYINTIMGWSPANWDDGTVTAGIMGYAARRIQAELQERADNNDPVYDEDGSLMQLEAPYTVDYSKYETE